VEVRGEAVLRTGRAAAEIVDAARERDAVMIATHGRRGVSHLLLGSVAERVVRTAPGPVLVLRPSAGGAVPEAR
jgi:nucleotide-binding universal stress UspA family protein